MIDDGAPSGPSIIHGVDPEGMHQTDDGAFGKGSEVTTVQTVRDAGVDEKNFVFAEPSAAAPLWQGAVLTVAPLRGRDLAAGDKDALIQPANRRSGQRRHALQQQGVLG